MTSSRHKKLIAYIILLIFMSCSLVFWSMYNLVATPLIPYESPPVVIQVDKAATASHFVQTLKDKNLIQYHKPILLYIRASGLAPKLKAGVYQVKPGENAMQLLERVASGDVVTQKFAIIAGTTQLKIAQDLMKAEHLDYHPEDWNAIQENHPNVEGLVLADTYQYQGGSSSKTLLLQAHRNLMTYLTKVWENRAPNLPYKTPYELLTAASIIEKESAVPQERQLISGVVVNRLNKKMPLQMDPTVVYGLGAAYTGKLSHNDMQVDSPYNTYRYRGLPPTPIAMVSKEALDAAAHPQLSNYLYFVAKGDGTHQFSETYEQQRQAINQFQRKGS
ncbi:MAG: endolytic transglycosylase MltG [Legionella sp.]|nr:endolytic transglycosylase MltG [Legionella sp.]